MRPQRPARLPDHTKPGRVRTYIDTSLIDHGWKKPRLPEWKRRAIEKARKSNTYDELIFVKKLISAGLDQLWTFGCFDHAHYLPLINGVVAIKYHSLIARHEPLITELIKKECRLRYFRTTDVFYKTTAWKLLKKKALDRDHKQCRTCGCKDNLQVHHINYRQISNKLSDLITLCLDCHQKYHKKNKLSR